MAAKVGTIERSRKVFFFRLRADNDDKGKPLNLAPEIERRVKALDRKRESSRVDVGDDKFLMPLWDAERCIRMVSVRHGDLPQLFDAGDLKPLPIKPDQSVADQTHFRFFDNRIVGVEYNHHGPRYAALSTFAAGAFRDMQPFSLAPLVREDTLKQLESVQELTRVEFTLRVPDLAGHERKGIDGMAVDLAKEINGAKVNVIVTAERADDDGLSVARVKSALRRMMGIEAASKARIKGYDTAGRGIVLDLIRDRLMSQQTMLALDENSRSVDPKSAYAAIAAAYNVVKKDLVGAGELD